jgi:hypothetical protein
MDLNYSFRPSDENGPSSNGRDNAKGADGPGDSHVEDHRDPKIVAR